MALFHFGHGAHFFSAVRNGYLFVDLFFVISGFVIYSAYATRLETAASLRAFLIRRFGRLFPLLVFSTLLYVLVKNLVIWAKHKAITLGYGAQFERADFPGYAIPDLTELVATLTLTHGMGFVGQPTLNPVSWSISTEFYAYVLFALVCLALRGSTRLIVFVVLSAAGFFATAWATIHLHDCFAAGKCFDVTQDFGFARCVGAFFLGALTCHASRRLPLNANALQWAGLIGLGALLSLAESLPVLVFASPLLFAVLVFSVSRDTGFAAALLKSRPMQVLGQRSYSVYMLHPVLMLFFEPLARRAHGVFPAAVVIVAYIALLVFASGWTYKVVEDPLRKWFNRIAGKKGPPAVVMQSSAP